MPTHLLRLALLAILLLAFALRAYHLDFQSLWSDEGISLQRVSMSLGAMLAAMPVEHTPGYFVLLFGWVRLTGDSDFALRYLSLLPSVLAVALVFRLAADVDSRPGLDADHRWIGAAAALLLATGGFQLWYAQEARMYAWLLAAGAASCWALWRLLERPGGHRWAWALLYALSTAALVYFHLYGALLPAAQAAFVLGWALVRRDWRAFGVWIVGAAAALLLFAPWLPHALGIFSFGGWREGGNAAEIPWRYWAAYTAGDSLAEPWHGLLPWAYALLAVLGFVFWWCSRRTAAIYLALLLLLPLAGVFLLALRNPDYHERYTIFVTVPLALLVAGALGLCDPRCWRRTAASRTRLAAGATVAALVLAALVLGNALAVQRLYTDATLHKPDYRAAAQRIQDNLQPGDVVLVDGPDPQKVFLHYYHGAAPVYAVGDLEHADAGKVAARLGELTQNKQRAWELLFFHNPAAVQVWLATQAWATEPTDHNGLRVTLYGLADAAPVSRTLDVQFGDALTLESAEVSTLTPQPGDLLRITTRWFTHAQAPEYKFSLRLSNAAGEPVQTVDYVPQNWFAPTNAWLVERPAADQRGLLLPPDLPPGPYRLTLRLYSPADGAPVKTDAGEDVLLAELAVGDAP